VRAGLTGSLGAGKSTVAKALAARGAIVIDADQVAHEVTAPGSPGELAVLERFGDRAAVRSSGDSPTTRQLDRRALADIVFSDASERTALEAITHPLIRAEVMRRSAEVANGVVVIELPLLDKSRKSDYGIDVVVLVDAPGQLAIERAIGRGMSEAQARARVAAQPSTEERRLLADRVLLNDGSLGQLERAVDALWEWLLGIEGQLGRPKQ
jgi:dephospho-CoA kinase